MLLDPLIHLPNANSVTILVGDCIDILRTLPEMYFQTCVTSPPYFGLRDYKMPGQIGLEATPDEYVTHLIAVFREVRRVLRTDGTVWLNLGDSYARTGGTANAQTMNKHADTHRTAIHASSKADLATGVKSKDLLGMPWRVAFGLQADGWWIRSAIVHAKGNPMPESVRDRPTSAYEHVFLLARAEQYYYDADAIAEPVSDLPQTRARNTRADKGVVGNSALYGDGFGQSGVGGFARADHKTKNARNVWHIPVRSFKGAHFATMTPELARRCIVAGCPEGGQVLDPFGGAGTTGLVAAENNRKASLIELNPDYAQIARVRLNDYAAP